MPLIETPLPNWMSLAQTVARAVTVQAAIDALTAGIADALRTRVCCFRWIEQEWTLVSAAGDGVRLAASDLTHALNAPPRDGTLTSLDLRAIGKGVWTSISIGARRGSPLALVVAGDRGVIDRMVMPLTAVFPLALAAVQEREARKKAETTLTQRYAMARRLARLESVEMVCQRIVEQVGRSVCADRVTLALYRADEDRLAIVAARGYPLGTVRDVRIEPGAWVVGHVFASKRPVLVRDARRLPQAPVAGRSYRTSSFVAVPLRAGSETLGVLSATDKRDESAFNRRDVAALLTFGVAGTLGLIAARSRTEVHRLAHVAATDSLTGLFNRHYFDERLHQELERARRMSLSLTVLLADVDDFKQINDSYGHPVGDAVLQALGAIVRASVRVFDVCARYGGDELAILMPSGDHTSAAACADRIRQRVADDRLRDETLRRIPRLTLSFGVAAMVASDTTADLVGRADRSLYQAKADGKDCVRISPEPNGG